MVVVWGGVSGGCFVVRCSGVWMEVFLCRVGFLLG